MIKPINTESIEPKEICVPFSCKDDTCAKCQGVCWWG